MKRFILILLIAGIASAASAQVQEGYKVTLQTPSYKNGLAYLTYYYGKNINIEDSAIINSNGSAVFTGSHKLMPGIYSIIFPGKTKLVDFLVDKDQAISIKADTADLLNKTVITGSKENVLFHQYTLFIAKKGKQLESERLSYAASKTRADSLLHEKKYAQYSKELQHYRDSIVAKYPASILATLFLAMKQPALLKEHPVTKEDSLSNYYYYRAHYWDGISFMDDRIIRTPFFIPKLETFFREIIPQAADSIVKESDYLLLFARNNQEMYKFMLNWLTDEYISPKYMGQDAVFVHIFEKYHSKGVSTWLNEKQMKTISDRAYMLMSNLVGNPAPDLVMTDAAGQSSSLYKVPADYTVVIFWDPTCVHCQKEVPSLDSIYRAKWKAEGVKIFAVLTEKELPKWKEYIKAHDLSDWVNVYQTEEDQKREADAQQPGFKQLYDVVITPTLYLLDKDKRIIAKKLTLQQMDQVLQVKIKSKKG